MKKCLILFLAVIIQLTLRSQDTVRVSPDLELIRISDNAYVHVSSSVVPGYGKVEANGLVYIQNHKALLFDTPWNDTLTATLVTFLKDKWNVRVTGFVPNHWHADCMGGLGYLKSINVKSYANRVTIDIARKKGLPVPDQGFDDSLTLRLGDETVLCFFPGAAHSLDNIVVWIPSEKILFPGCICKSVDAQNLGNTSDGDVSQYKATLDRIVARFSEAVVIIPGHGSRGGPELLRHTGSLASGAR
jgi:metallo-beta-lactamase class B